MCNLQIIKFFLAWKPPITDGHFPKKEVIIY